MVTIVNSFFLLFISPEEWNEGKDTQILFHYFLLNFSMFSCLPLNFVMIG